MRKRLGWIGLGALFMIGILGAGVWLTRLWWLPWLLRWILGGLPVDRLRYEAARWEGRTITLYQVSLYKGTWHLYIDSLSLRLRWRPSLYFGKTQLSHYETTTQSPPSPSSPSDPLKLIQKGLSQLEKLDTLFIPHLLLPHHLSCALYKGGDSLRLTALYDSIALTLEAKKHNGYYEWALLPASFSLRRLDMAWSSLKGSLTWQEDTLRFSALGRGISLYHPRLASHRLSYDSVGGLFSLAYTAPQWHLIFTPQALPLDFSLHAHGYGRDSFQLHLQVPPQPFDAYQRAFPRGFFSVLAQARLRGTSALNIQLRYNPLLPDTLTLEVSWKTEGFSIHSWPPPNPLMLREDFSYRPWGSARTLLLSPKNPNYLTYHQIHPYVLFAILHSEDGGFFYHQGFHKELFLKALLENWRCKCFRRGAGTITMQLVRNLLLSRQKNLARKVEEICLTALIERFRLLSKERILELYLNMVEWGPEVYGLNEASQFYFGKGPYDLTLSEAIFLGLLLPSPKNYRYFVDDSTQCAKESLGPVFQRIGYFVRKANFVPEDSTQSLSPSQVCLKGPARRIFLPPDSLSEE